MSNKIKEKEYQKIVEHILSDLYNGLSESDEYKIRYSDLRNEILNSYKKIENGAYAVPLVNELLTKINHEILKNYKLKENNPKIFSPSIQKLEKTLDGPSSGLWLADYAAMFGNYI